MGLGAQETKPMAQMPEVCALPPNRPSLPAMQPASDCLGVHSHLYLSHPRISYADNPRPSFAISVRV